MSINDEIFELHKALEAAGATFPDHIHGSVKKDHTCKVQAGPPFIMLCLYTETYAGIALDEEDTQRLIDQLTNALTHAKMQRICKHPHVVNETYKDGSWVQTCSMCSKLVASHFVRE